MKKEPNEYHKKLRLDTTPERLAKAMLNTPPTSVFFKEID